MRSSSIIAFALSAIGVSAVAVGKQSDQPACVAKCWANSQYVSNCAGNQQCLCDDAEFQNAMYQCLYSQCQTAQFGVSLHHALALCSDEQAPSYTSVAPAMLRQGGDLRKRGLATQSNSVAYTRTSTRASATESTPIASAYSSGRASTKTSTRGSASVSASAYMTYSTSRASPTSVASVLSVEPSAVTVYNTVTYTASSATTTAAASEIIVTVTESVSVVAATSTSSAVVSQISDGQVQEAYAEAASLRQTWDTQRYPSSNSS